MIGLDIGGANVKLASAAGVAVRYCPLWENAPLADTIRDLAGGMTEESTAVVMSGELADSFASKDDGIAWIVNQVRDVFPGARFYGTDGEFHAGAVPQLAAANWLAAADYLRDVIPEGVLVDMGSTTTDIIPLGHFTGLKGMTDLDRLRAGFLCYTGLLRTPVAAHLPEVTIGGVITPLAKEVFATAADAHLLLGHIRPEEFTCHPADRRGTGTADAVRRLSRMACSDPGEIGPGGAWEIAKGFWRAQQEIITRTVDHVLRDSGADQVFTAGIGSSLLARSCGWTDLRERIGSAVDALPAFSIREVALRCGIR